MSGNRIGCASFFLGLFKYAAFLVKNAQNVSATFEGSETFKTADADMRASSIDQNVHQMNGGYAFGRVKGNVYIERQERAISKFQLPRRTNDFTGRDLELDEILVTLKQAIKDEAVAILSLVGMAGIGKSALAICAAHQAKSYFPDLQLYMNLREEDGQPKDVGTVLKICLQMLGFGDGDIPSHVDELATRYRSRLSGKKALVLIDNAQNREQVEPLLPGSEGCAVIVTSRKSLVGLEGKKEVVLTPMTLLESLALLEKLVGEKQVTESMEAAREVVQLCGHLPLAIRITGATLNRKRHWNLELDYLPLLRDEQRRLNYLSQDEKYGLRTSFELSYKNIEDLDQHVFKILGVLPSDFGLEVAKEIGGLCSMEETEKCLDKLVDAQLLEAVEKQRYCYHDLMRLYARGLLLPDEISTAKRNYSQWYLDKADEFKESIESSHKNHFATDTRPNIYAIEAYPLSQIRMQEAATWLSEESGNLLLVLKWANEQGL